MAKSNLGLVHVYTGDGKGKTSASMGLVMRAIGQGMKVHVIQFMKGGAYTGEFITGKNFLPAERITMVQYGRPCIKENKQLKLQGFDSGYTFFDYIREDIECGECRFCFLNDDEQAKYVNSAFEKTKEVVSSGEFDLVVLDEINVAMSLNFLDTDKVVEIIKNRFPQTEVILTGRGAPQKILDIADYASEIKMLKHPFEKGIAARRGIEY